MHNATNTALDRAASLRGLRSDYALAKAIGRSRQTLSGYRHGKSQMDDEAAIRTAELAGINPEALIAELAAERAKSPGVREHWLRLANLARQQQPETV